MRSPGWRRALRPARTALLGGSPRFPEGLSFCLVGGALPFNGPVSNRSSVLGQGLVSCLMCDRCPRPAKCLHPSGPQTQQQFTGGKAVRRRVPRAGGGGLGCGGYCRSPGNLRSSCPVTLRTCPAGTGTASLCGPGGVASKQVLGRLRPAWSPGGSERAFRFAASATFE